MPFLTDSGLDQIGTNSPNFGSSVPISVGQIGDYLAVGTGALTPSNATTDIATQVESRSRSNGGFTGSSTFTAETDYLKSVIVYTRVLAFTTSHTLTNWGLFTGTTGGNCGVVDLFRSDPNDVLSSAVTISVQDGDELQMTFTWDFRISPYGVEADTLALDIDGTETTPAGDSTFYGDSSVDYERAFEAWQPTKGIGTQFRIGTFSDANLANTTGGTVLATSNSSGGILSSYTTGDYERTLSITFNTSSSNGDIHGFWMATSVNSGGFKTVLDAPITKTALQELTVVFTRSWARA